MKQDLSEILRSIPDTQLSTVIPFSFGRKPYHIFDLTESNVQLREVDLQDEQGFTHFIFDTLKQAGCRVGVGGYGEDRYFYQRSTVFGEGESRSIHLGIDVWAEAGMPVLAPLAGKVHSFADNDSHGDYGPTIILAHEWEGRSFYSLYGHLSKASLVDLHVGQPFAAGQTLGYLGAYHENVHWPPHLHFQLIEEIGEYKGDYPGVAFAREKEHYLSNCPDPNLLLRIEGL